jgi:hypothetical protein
VPFSGLQAALLLLLHNRLSPGLPAAASAEQLPPLTALAGEVQRCGALSAVLSAAAAHWLALKAAEGGGESGEGGEGRAPTGEQEAEEAGLREQVREACVAALQPQMERFGLSDECAWLQRVAEQRGAHALHLEPGAHGGSGSGGGGGVESRARGLMLREGQCCCVGRGEAAAALRLSDDYSLAEAHVLLRASGLCVILRAGPAARSGSFVSGRQLGAAPALLLPSEQLCLGHRPAVLRLSAAGGAPDRLRLPSAINTPFKGADTGSGSPRLAEESSRRGSVTAGGGDGAPQNKGRIVRRLFGGRAGNPARTGPRMT